MSEIHHDVSYDDDCTIVTVAGEIDISNARAMRTLLLKVLAGSRQVRLDIGAVASMDSSGIATLIEARAKALEEGKSFQVTAASDRVRMALKLLCIEKMLMGS